VKFDVFLLKIFQRNAAADVVKLVTNFELLVEQRSIWTQETAHQVTLAQMKGLKKKIEIKYYNVK
jgi:hypothetical protein